MGSEMCIRDRGTRGFDLDLILARSADPPAATDAKQARRIHVPLLETDRAPRPVPRRRRLPLRVRLPPHAGRLVFRGDPRADLVGVRPRRGAVEHLARRRRRGRRRLRARRRRRPDLFTRLAVAPFAPVDLLTSYRAILSCFAWTIELGLLTCLLYTSPSPRDLSTSRMPSSA